MNEANQFYEDMRSQRQTLEENKEASGTDTSESGDGEAPKEEGATTTTGGTPSQAGTDLNLTPNG